MYKVIRISKNDTNKEYYNKAEQLLCYCLDKAEKRCKLYSCQAKIYEYAGFLILVSYNTPVAFYSPNTNTLYDFLRPIYGYTATSAKHISKFSKWLAENNFDVFYFERFTD